MAFNILIIEDEYLLAQELEEILTEIDASNNVLAKLGSIEESVNWLKNNECDLIFMDIQLSDGLSFSIFDRVQVQPPVIFTTAYNQYTIEAFKTNGIAYILKPIDKDEIIKALEKYKLLEQSLLKKNQKVTPSQSHKPSKYKEQLVLSSGAIKKIVNVKSILFFQADDRYVFAMIAPRRRMFLNYTLKELENNIDPYLFFRINRTFIINRGAIKEWMSYSKGRIKLFLNIDYSSDFIVSRARTIDFKLWIKK